MSGRLHKEPFAQIPEWLLYSGVSDRAVRVFAVLDRHADKEGRAFPGRPKLAALVGCHVNSLDRAIGELRDAGALTTTARFREDGSRSSSDYWLWPASPDMGVPTTTGGEGGTTTTGEPLPPPMVEQEREPDEREPVGTNVVPIGTTRDVDTRSSIGALCDQLANAIEHHTTTRPKISPAWQRDMRLLIERGPLDVDAPQPLSAEKIGRAIEFTFTRLAERGADGFCWADQIQSPSGLRRKWRRLVAAGVKLQQQRRGRGADAVAAAAARLESGESLLGLFGGQPTKEAENHA